jgi:2-dehydropantoate 2-reductase
MAVRLATAVHAVGVLARGTTLAAVRARGMRLHDLDGSHVAHPPATDDPGVLGPQDLIFLCTKTTALAEVLPALRPMLTPDTVVVPAINGVPWWYFHGTGAVAERVAAIDPDGTLGAALAPSHLLGCVVSITAEALAPGLVRSGNAHRLDLGELDHRSSSRLKRTCRLLTDAGIAAEATDRIRDHVWSKILANLSAKPLSVLTGATLEQIYGQPALLPVVRKILGEAMLTAAAYGVRLPFDPDAIIAKGASMGPVRTSMLQDFELGRPLELAAIGDAVLELAERKGITMTTTADIIALARARGANRAHG